MRDNADTVRSPASSTLFTDPAYIDALERSGCASVDQGWTPRHIDDAGGRLVCYEKTHSWGEFVFDFELARFWRQFGQPYYPKLVSCVPFTPVPGARLLAGDDAQRLALARRLRTLASEGYSGAHILFIADDERALLEGDGWILRAQPRYVWHAGEVQDFEGFLATLSSKKRKNIRAERRKLGGFRIEWRSGALLTESEWPRVYALYASTYYRRGQEPYLNLTCLRAWAAAFGERMQFCLAWHGEQLAAIAFFFEDGDTLYGRHWGADALYDALHFELCYYQGIERCFARGLQHFDAGVQGEHKQARGFAAELAWSAHCFTHEGLHAAVARAYAEERETLLAWQRESRKAGEAGAAAAN